MKLSKHPVGTFAHIEGQGHYEKVERGLWRHADGTANYLTKKYIRNLEKNHPEKIKIIAAPWRVTVELMQMLMEEYGHTDSEGTPITFDSVYKDAVARDEESQRINEEQQRAYVNYCDEDVRATEIVYRIAGRSMFEEEWRQIPGYNWSISNQGRVRNDNISQHIMRPFVVNGQMKVEITDDQGRYLEKSVASLMMEAFPEKGE